jgi:hypothetical protein
MNCGRGSRVTDRRGQRSGHAMKNASHCSEVVLAAERAHTGHVLQCKAYAELAGWFNSTWRTGWNTFLAACRSVHTVDHPMLTRHCHTIKHPNIC